MSSVFISYSHQDEPWKDRVVRHLGVLQDTGLAVWDDRRIAAGDDWRGSITAAIAGCDLALLLISAHFLTSRFILDQEVPVLLQRRREQGVCVIPVILSPCAWTRVPWLAAIQSRPRDGAALSAMPEHQADAALAELAGEVADLLLTPMTKAASLPTPAPTSGSSATATSAAAEIWREKLEFLREQEAICSDPAQRFTLRKQIQEAEAKLRELS